MRRVRILAVIGAVAVLAACTADGGGESASAGGADGGTTVDVTLQEWAVVVSEDSVPAGEVTFAITNDGPEDVHEFVIFRTDLDAAELPTDETGAVDESGEGIEVVDEVEDVAVGASEELTVTLDAGNYVLVCNIYSEDEDEAHYQMGMRTPFTATE
jgi:uncharacterized cupredoxin-like copper-binding protein